jgi:WD40 repeat protein
VAFSPKGDVLASGGHDNAVHLWNVTNSPTLGELAVLRGHRDAVRSVAFSPDGKILATASSDRTAKLWDVTDLHGARVLAPLSHQGSVWGVAFRPDGKILATASHDKTVRLWETDVDRIATRICAIAHPTITRTEWHYYFPDLTYRPSCP